MRPIILLTKVLEEIMRNLLIALAILVLSFSSFADIEPSSGISQCVPALMNLRVIDVKLSEGDRGVPSVRVTFTNGNRGYFQYEFTGEHMEMGFALVPMIERKAGNYQKKVNISCKRFNNDYVVSLNLYKTK